MTLDDLKRLIAAQNEEGMILKMEIDNILKVISHRKDVPDEITLLVQSLRDRIYSRDYLDGAVTAEVTLPEKIVEVPVEKVIELQVPIQPPQMV